MKNPLPCLICGRDMDHAMGAHTSSDPVITNQPYHGLGVRTNGHYGSMFFDPGLATVMLEFAVCDPCLTARKNRLRVIAQSTPPAIANVLPLAEWVDTEIEEGTET